MLYVFAKIGGSTACNAPGISVIGNWQINTFNSVENVKSNVLKSIWSLNSNPPARNIKNTSCKPSALLNFCNDVPRYNNRVKRVLLEQRATYLSAEKTNHAEYRNEIIGTEISKINLKTNDDAVIRHREIRIETPSLHPSVEVIDDRSTYQYSSRSQTHWLSVGENIGAWLVKIKPNISQGSK